MAYVRMSLAEARKKGQLDSRHVAATTETEIREHMLEDGFDPDKPFEGLREIVGTEAVRVRTGLSQAEFADVLEIPLPVLQDWESGRAQPDPVAEALFALIDDEPTKAVRVLTMMRSARRLRRPTDVAASSA